MGKHYKPLENPKADPIDTTKFEEKQICMANGTYCLKGCKVMEDTKCLRLENKKKAINGSQLS